MLKVAVVPAWNEAKNLKAVLSAFCSRLDVVIAVNDGSTDTTSAILREWVATQTGCYVIDNPVNRGKASALKDGFVLAAGLLESGTLSPDDLLFTFDADGQHTQESIDSLAEATCTQQLDMLLTQRDFSHYPRFKKVGNWGLSLIASILGGYRYRDVECGLRVIRLGRLPDLLAYYTGYKYSCEQELGIIAAGLRMRIDNTWRIEVPFYRTGTKLPDGIINVAMGILAWLRLRLGLRTSRAALARRLDSRVIIASPGAPLPTREGSPHSHSAAASAVSPSRSATSR